MGDDPQVRVALTCWQVIAAATDERLTPPERGLVLSEIAAEVHRDADGRPLRVTKRTLYRWLAAWRCDGFDGLKPQPRTDAGSHTRPTRPCSSWRRRYGGRSRPVRRR